MPGARERKAKGPRTHRSASHPRKPEPPNQMATSNQAALAKAREEACDQAQSRKHKAFQSWQLRNRVADALEDRAREALDTAKATEFQAVQAIAKADAQAQRWADRVESKRNELEKREEAEEQAWKAFLANPTREMEKAYEEADDLLSEARSSLNRYEDIHQRYAAAAARTWETWAAREKAAKEAWQKADARHSLSLQHADEAEEEYRNLKEETEEVCAAPPVPRIRWSVGGKEAGEDLTVVSKHEAFRVTATFENIPDPKGAGAKLHALKLFSESPITLPLLNGPLRSGAVEISNPIWEGPNTVSWEITPKMVGPAPLMLNIAVPGWQPVTLRLVVQVTLDRDAYTAKLMQAHLLVDTAFSIAQRYVINARRNYRQAYEDHRTAIASYSRREALKQELVLAIVFGAVGGVAGGAVAHLGKVLGKGVAQQAVRAASAASERVGRFASTFAPRLHRLATGKQEGLRKLLEESVTGAVTDLVKDTVKATVRFPAKSIPAGKGRPGIPTQRESGASKGSLLEQHVGQTGHMDREAAAMNPDDWADWLEEAIVAQGTAVLSTLLQLSFILTETKEGKKAQEFYRDPVAIARAMIESVGLPLYRYDPSVVPTKEEYEKAFWAAWLSQHAYGTTRKIAVGGHDAVIYYVVELQMDDTLLKEIDKVARKFGESAEQWLEEYGNREEARKRADDLNSFPNVD